MDLTLLRLFKETNPEWEGLTGTNENEKSGCSTLSLVKASHTCVILITFTLK